MAVGVGVRLGGFVLAVGAVFAGAYGVGVLAGPVAPEAEPAEAMTHGGEPVAEGALPAGGLLVSERGYTLRVVTAGIVAGVGQEFAFRILDDHGEPVTEFEVKDDRAMHLIVVRRDLSGFQHVHPELGADGTWRVPLTFAEAGQYRVFADFRPAGIDGDLTLGADVAVAGEYRPRALPAPARTAGVDGYEVTLGGELMAGESRPVTLTVRRDGREVTDLETYLGSFGHLVVLRDGDLAYLHVHPDERNTGPGTVPFVVEVPSAGGYRLYLNFQHAGVVRTAEFTVNVGERG
jgi:hypothetical protein